MGCAKETIGVGGKLAFAALGFNVSDADKPTVDAKFLMSDLIAIAAVGAMPTKCQLFPALCSAVMLTLRTRLPLREAPLRPEPSRRRRASQILLTITYLKMGTSMIPIS
jgi:hypothetical protein